MQTEIWDILNDEGKPTGKTMARGNYSFKSGEYHLVVHIRIVSPDGKFLIQRRADSRKLMPGEWAATGGAAQAGEQSFTAASRELFEELGIASNSKTLTFLARIKRRNSFLDIWNIVSDIPAGQLKLQKSEVAEAKWVTREEFSRMIENGKYHNYGREYFSIILGEN